MVVELLRFAVAAGGAGGLACCTAVLGRWYGTNASYNTYSLSHLLCRVSTIPNNFLSRSTSWGRTLVASFQKAGGMIAASNGRKTDEDA